ncbi:hypothetical protein ACQPW1_25190 [Nocardia sp. CA-128927]|uniref:hypothetical protein n=1 Tax=Nocardia sp. CA-128927 TaxID=3239975 RepID=UPI003D96C521
MQHSGPHRAATLAVSGRQPGDPARAAAAIAVAVDAEVPPLRLLLGSDALAGTRARLKRLRGEIDANEALTASVDLEEGSVARTSDPAWALPPLEGSPVSVDLEGR